MFWGGREGGVLVKGQLRGPCTHGIFCTLLVGVDAQTYMCGNISQN